MINHTPWDRLKKQTHLSLPVFYTVSISFTLIGAYVYYLYSPAADAALLALFILLFFLFDDGGGFTEKSRRKLLLFAGCAWVILHMYKCLWPMDFYRDEWGAMVNAWSYAHGKTGFFHYSRLNGSSMPLIFNAMAALLIKTTGTIAYLRILPLFIFILTCLSFYLLGREIKDKNTGIALFFIYSAASLTFYLSRQITVNSHIALLISAGLYFFLAYVRSKKPAFLAAWLACYACGFCTYAGWFFTVPVWISAGLIYLRFEPVKRKLFYFSAVIAAAAAGFFLYSTNPESISRVTEQGSPAGLLPLFARALKSIALYLSGNMANPHNSFSYSQALPLFSFVEFLLLGGGIIWAVFRAERKLGLLLICGLVFASASFFFGTPLLHQLRHITFYTFAVIIAGLFLDEALATRWRAALLPLLFLLPAGVLVDMHANWESRMKNGSLNYEIAAYITKEYPGKKFVLVHEIMPYSSIEIAARTGNTDEGASTVIFISTYFMKEPLKKAFNAEIKKIFYDTLLSGKFPVVLYETVNMPEKDIVFIKKMKSDLDEINMQMRDYRHGRAAAMCATRGFYPASTPEEKFYNTVLRILEIEACAGSGNTSCVNNAYTRSPENIYFTADMYYYRAKFYYLQGMTKDAIRSYEEAAKSAPWWPLPQKKLKELGKMRGRQ